jgi:hypothetical protein
MHINPSGNLATSNLSFKQGGQIGRLFTLGSGLKITKVEHIFGRLFSTVPDVYLL